MNQYILFVHIIQTELHHVLTCNSILCAYNIYTIEKITQTKNDENNHNFNESFNIIYLLHFMTKNGYQQMMWWYQSCVKISDVIIYNLKIKLKCLKQQFCQFFSNFIIHDFVFIIFLCENLTWSIDTHTNASLTKQTQIINQYCLN